MKDPLSRNVDQRRRTSSPHQPLSANQLDRAVAAAAGRWVFESPLSVYND